MTAELASLDELVSPYGVVSTAAAMSPYSTLGLYFGSSNVGSGWAGQARPRKYHIDCGGSAWESPEHARFIAIAEGAERYAGLDNLGEPRIWASADELAGECLEPSRYPRCSDNELSRPQCPISRFDPAAPIRWVSGLDLISLEHVWVPATMACFGLHPEVPAEHIVNRLSTGFAVHTDPTEAVVRGICEVVERDANAVLWLQRLPLPSLGQDHWTERVSRSVEWYRRHFVEVRLFDATSDVGIPTAYCVLDAVHDPRVRRTVSAGTGRSLALAAERALDEAIGTRSMLLYEDDGPDDLSQFVLVHHGAQYMAKPERAGAFDFLVEGSETRPSPGREAIPEEPDRALAVIIDKLAASDMRPVVVDRTTRELADVGLTAVKVIIPDLQPMSLDPLAQFKGHRRLYEAPIRMGYRALSEEELNPWPQPFP